MGYDRESNSELFHRMGAVEQGQKDLREQLITHTRDTKEQFRVTHKWILTIAFVTVITLAMQPKVWEVVIPFATALVK